MWPESASWLSEWSKKLLGRTTGLVFETPGVGSELIRLPSARALAWKGEERAQTREPIQNGSLEGSSWLPVLEPLRVFRVFSLINPI